MFKVLRNNIGDESLNVIISEKVVPVPGDISLNNMGVSDFNLEQAMMQEIEIVFHAAATTRFDERYAVVHSLTLLFFVYIMTTFAYFVIYNWFENPY